MLGEHVRNIRKKRGITLKELAEKTGLSIGYISQIERDLTDPSLSTLRKLSAALDIPTYLFMGGESSTSLTTRQADMLILSQPNSNVRYHLLTPMPNGNFVPQSLVIRFELEPHCKDGDLPVIHPSEEILLRNNSDSRYPGSCSGPAGSVDSYCISTLSALDSVSGLISG